MLRAARTLVLFGCLLVAAGCGGDDGGSGSGSGSSDNKRVTVKDGEEATFRGPNGTFDVAITAEAEKGSIDDLKDFRLEEAEQDMTPWYVRHTVENRGDDLTSEDAFAAVVDAFDDTGSEPRKIIPLGDFTKCELENVPDPFKSGEQVTSCDLYLVEEGATLDELVVTETRFEGDSIDHVWKVG